MSAPVKAYHRPVPLCPWCGWEAGMAPGLSVSLRFRSELRMEYGTPLRYYDCPACEKAFVTIGDGEPLEAAP